MTNYVYKLYSVTWLLVTGILLVATSQESAAAVSTADVDLTAQASEPGIVAHCTSCHGSYGDSLGPAIPTIGGLSRNYLIGAMLAYKFSDNLDQADALIEGDQGIEDVVVLTRPLGIMNTVAEMLSVEEIKEIAAYLSKLAPSSPEQIVDVELANKGADIHQRYCEKCHEDGGTSALDDVGILAGRWKLYLTYVFDDLSAGRRQMPKKMAKKFNAVREDHGDTGFQQLIDYYAGQLMVRDGS